MNKMNNEWMQKIIRNVLFHKLDELPEETKAVLEKTRVDVTRLPDQVVITIDIETNGNPEAEQIRDVILDSLLTPISQIVTILGCQANIEQLS